MVDKLPYSTLSERQVLGAMLLSNSLIADIVPLLVAEDFYNPTHQRIYEQILFRWRRGDEVDVPIIATDLGEHIINPGALLGMIAETESLGGSVTHARNVANLSSVRAVAAIAEDVRELALNASEPREVLEYATTKLAHVPVPIRTYKLDSINEFLDGGDDDYEWIIPDVVETGDRVVIVASEGLGKSMFLRQIAVMASQGIHPFTETRMRPLRVLLLDLENGVRLIRRKLRPIVLQAQHTVGDDYTPENLVVECIPEGLNVLSRVDRDTIEGMCATFQPELVVAGPLYKLFDTPSGGKDSTGGETVAKETVRILDSLRTRYGFGLILEHHAPKATGGKRDLNPFGSAVWLRWPEFGLSIERSFEFPDTYEMKHFRGPRDERAWPTLLRKGGVWPWTVIE